MEKREHFQEMVFKIRCFIFFQAKPHLQTFRSEKAKSASYKHQESDGIGRQGVFGHGVYESAKC